MHASITVQVVRIARELKEAVTDKAMPAVQAAKTHKKLSYRCETARCWFVQLLRYGRTFCQYM